MIELIKPQNWPLTRAKVVMTTVQGGVSKGSFSSLNLGTHVGDDPADVAQNRHRLSQAIGGLPICWLNQVHADAIYLLNNLLPDENNPPSADAVFTEQTGIACAILTADCLPIVISNRAETKIAALHCGWRGLYANLIGKMLKTHFAGEQTVAWIGAGIGSASYEVDDGLRERFVMQNQAYATAFSPSREGHYWFDLYAIARAQLKAFDCVALGGDFDTFTDARFFSYRQNPKTGRMATLIYLEK